MKEIRAIVHPWEIYDALIEGIPEDIDVKSYALGTRWSYVEAESGMGIAWTTPNSSIMPRQQIADVRAMSLREAAALSKSWNFQEASLGVAALNAWYSQPEQLKQSVASGNARIDGLESKDAKAMDAFALYKPHVKDKNVVVVGHFPHLDDIAAIANLHILERVIRDAQDLPDPACEYVMPEADYAFITGVTFINKTAPRLLQLSQRAHTIFVGPSAPMAPVLFDYGVEMLAGSVVVDLERTKYAVTCSADSIFKEGVSMVSLVQV